VGQGRLILACTLLLVPAGAATSVLAAPFDPAGAGIADSRKLLLEADELIYDFDGATVTAVGNVQIYYGDYVLDAEKIVYDQRTGRLVASGGVRILEPDGNLVTADTVDITDDFRDGFIASLNVITTEGGRFTAQSAERRDGELLIFHRGAYTACTECALHRDKPPLWQIKATRIIHDRSDRTVYYENARLEFLGIPIAYVPFFFHPDPTVKRKTGFLTPSILHRDSIGFGITTPFFWNLAPNYDVTFAPTFLTRQGLLMETRWRHRLMNGAYSIRAAGIFQQDKGAFVDDGDRLSGYRDFRGSVTTEGSFAINDRWTYGWEAHAVSDRIFNRDYRIAGATAKDLPSTVYLTGLSDRNYFDARGYYFLVQREDTVENPDTPDEYVHDDQAEQAIVHPVVDHNYILDYPIFGGELRLDSNLQSLSRDESDIRHPPDLADITYAGVAGNFSRAASRATWKRRFIAPGGQLVTPFTYLQTDASWVAADDLSAGLSSDELIGRAMPAVGVEYEWPILATLGSSVHTFGPRAQLIARPDERSAGDLPNEDSQSLVFDDTSLFLFDKFAGYDRQEGGTRANLGLVYHGLFPSGATIDAIAGRSIQLAGTNSFALQDHALTGLGSGLESRYSDYLARITVNTGTGLAFTGRARLDDDTFAVNSGEVNAVATFGDSVASIGYVSLRESPSAGLFSRREEVNAAAAIEVVDNWSVLGSVVYDLSNDSLVTDSFGLAFANECLQISAVYSQTPDPYSDLAADHQVFVRVNLRTLGGGSFTPFRRDDED
jgi:LPS-assembly protein